MATIIRGDWESLAPLIYFHPNLKKWLKEEWASIKDYEGLYEVSNCGRVKSLVKSWICGWNKATRTKKESILREGISGTREGYRSVVLCKNAKSKTVKISLLVWDAFGNSPRNGKLLVVDHIDNNKHNDSIFNLQLLTNRENINKYHKVIDHTSLYNGVYWDKKACKWSSQIMINYKKIFVGYFNSEYEAHLAYQNKLKQIQT